MPKIDPAKIKRTLRMGCSSVQRSVSPDGRKIIRFTASTPNVDRAGDIVEPNWDLDNYVRTGMPFLWAHGYADLPIGRGVAVGVEAGNLILDVEFVPSDIYPFAGIVERLYDAGFLKSVSVGFRPVEWEPIDAKSPWGGMLIHRAELLEVSAVPVPMNADALVAGKGVAPVMRATYQPKEQVYQGVQAEQVRAFLKGGRMAEGSEAKVVVKMDPMAGDGGDAGPAGDMGDGGDMTIADMASRIVELITPADGVLQQSDLDEAKALLAKIIAASEGDSEDDGEGEDAEGDQGEGGADAAAMEAMKGAASALAEASKALVAETKAAIDAIRRSSNQLPDLDFPDLEDEPLERAFSDPVELERFAHLLEG